MARDRRLVAGYTFHSVNHEDPHDETVCQIVRRCEDLVLSENCPMFEVKFPDGTIYMARSDELHPWYPT